MSTHSSLRLIAFDAFQLTSPLSHLAQDVGLVLSLCRLTC
jgi:hypothetical protein